MLTCGFCPRAGDAVLRLHLPLWGLGGLEASFLSEELQVRNTAHEGYGHAYFYELSKNNPSVNPFHTKGVVTSILEYDPDLGISYYVPVFGNNNTLLEKRISMVENQAINNYENWKE